MECAQWEHSHQGGDDQTAFHVREHSQQGGDDQTAFRVRLCAHSPGGKGSLSTGTTTTTNTIKSPRCGAARVWGQVETQGI